MTEIFFDNSLFANLRRFNQEMNKKLVETMSFDRMKIRAPTL